MLLLPERDRNGCLTNQINRKATGSFLSPYYFLLFVRGSAPLSSHIPTLVGLWAADSRRRSQH